GDKTASGVPQGEDECRRGREAQGEYEGWVASATRKAQISNGAHHVCFQGTAARAVARAGAAGGRRVDRDRLGAVVRASAAASAATATAAARDTAGRGDGVGGG